jgi:predicted Zn-dependent protease with MMP-like domain
MNELSCFNPSQLRTVRQARARAAALVSEYYCVAPREWQQMPYEVKTLRALDHSEVTDAALAQTVCYNFKRAAGSLVLEEGDLYRICLQDHRILDAMRHTQLKLGSLLTYVITHELVHVVRFGQRLQRIDLPVELRDDEERKVEKTTRTILARASDANLHHFFAGHSASPF